MKKRIESNKLVEILKEREKTVKKGHPLFDKIEEVVTEVINNNIKRIATDSDMWKYIKPFVSEEEYKEANGKIGEIYRQIQKLEYKMNRLKEKTLKIVEDEKFELKEFEEISQVNLEGKEAFVEIIDKVESYKEMLREKKALDTK